MGNIMKFKVGDFVELLYSRYLGGDIEGNTYKIICVSTCDYLLSIPEGIRHLDYDGTNAGWWYGEEDVKLVARKDEQLLFVFMEE